MKKKTTVYLVAGGALGAFVDDDDVVDVRTGASDDTTAHENRALTEWEKTQNIRKITLIGKSFGTTKLRAQRDGCDWIAPMMISVVADPNARQVRRASGEVTDELGQELQTLSLREAVLRIAEDQLHSSVAASPTGMASTRSARIRKPTNGVVPSLIGAGVRLPPSRA